MNSNLPIHAVMLRWVGYNPVYSCICFVTPTHPTCAANFHVASQRGFAMTNNLSSRGAKRRGDLTFHVDPIAKEQLLKEMRGEVTGHVDRVILNKKCFWIQIQHAPPETDQFVL